jgi:hypothetical protein
MNGVKMKDEGMKIGNKSFLVKFKGAVSTSYSISSKAGGIGC